MAKNYEEMSDEEFSQEAPPEIEETSPAEEKVEEKSKIVYSGIQATDRRSLQCRRYLISSTGT